MNLKTKDSVRRFLMLVGPALLACTGATTSTTSNGTLAVDFYDPTSKDLLWRSTATRTLNPSGNQQKDMERLNKSVAKLLKNLPPPPPKK
jgi:hypothetical protein